MDRTARTVGIDVGGTKVAAALLDGTALVGRAEEPTRTDDSAALLAQIVRLIETFENVEAVGVGVPSVVRLSDGTALATANIPAFRDVPLRSELGRRLGIPVHVDNDANLAAVAEAWDDDLRLLHESVACLTVGTGLGGGVALRGRPLHGSRTSAFEIGHLTVVADVESGAPIGDGHGAAAPYPSSLEHWASGRALDRMARNGGFGSGVRVTEAALGGDETAIDLLRILGERVGVGLAAIITLLEPETIVLAGGLSRAGDLLLGPAREAAQRLVVPGVGTSTRIEIARYGADAGVRGAAILARLENARAGWSRRAVPTTAADPPADLVP